MEMLRELQRVRQISGEPTRRWFSSAEIDLVVWLNDFGEPFGFQLCYDKGGSERAITWEAGAGFTHSIVDSGDNRQTHHKQAPILRPGGTFDKHHVLGVFCAASSELPSAICALVREALETFPESPIIEVSRPQKRPPRKKEKRPWWWL